MLKFKSAAGEMGGQHTHPIQYNWESRAAQILTHLWKDIERKLPMPDLDHPLVSLDVIVNQSDSNDENNINGDVTTTGGWYGNKFRCMVYIPALTYENGLSAGQEDKHLQLNLDVFRHELIHCYQYLIETREFLDLCEKNNWSLTGTEFVKWHEQHSIEHTKTQQQYEKVVDKMADESSQRLIQLAKQNEPWEIKALFKNLLVPIKTKDVSDQMHLYCDMLDYEKDVAIKAGEVWTPQYTYDENVLIYHLVVPDVLQHLKDYYKVRTNNELTRQRIEKFELVDTALANLDCGPDAKRHIKNTLNWQFKPKYNYIERSELQLEAA